MIDRRKEPNRWEREEFDERAGILEYCGGWPRRLAEYLARKHCRARLDCQETFAIVEKHKS